MTISVGVCRDLRDRFLDRCSRWFPCLANPARRSSLCLKVALVIIHLVYAGALFLIDTDLIDTAKTQPWYVALYVLLFVATLVQYFVTAGTSPGYVVDAMRAFNETDSLVRAASTASQQRAVSKNGSVVVNLDGGQLGRSTVGSDTSSWTKLVLEMYPPGSDTGSFVRQCTCTYCNVLQPPRAKHCHDCDKCVLQFDHHCVWLGSCIGLGNHCRFWWYICEETTLCMWTVVMYIKYLDTNITRSWWMDAIMIMLLIALSISLIFLVLLLVFHSYLLLTNQTTYELVRRRRIGYMRGVPERVYPFSEGVCKNLCNFCCDWRRGFKLERLPSAEELEIRARPYSGHDMLCCRCC